MVSSELNIKPMLSRAYNNHMPISLLLTKFYSHCTFCQFPLKKKNLTQHPPLSFLQSLSFRHAPAYCLSVPLSCRVSIRGHFLSQAHCVIMDKGHPSCYSLSQVLIASLYITKICTFTPIGFLIGSLFPLRTLDSETARTTFYSPLCM